MVFSVKPIALKKLPGPYLPIYTKSLNLKSFPSENCTVVPSDGKWYTAWMAFIKLMKKAKHLITGSLQMLRVMTS